MHYTCKVVFRGSTHNCILIIIYVHIVCIYRLYNIIYYRCCEYGVDTQDIGDYVNLLVLRVYYILLRVIIIFIDPQNNYDTDLSHIQTHILCAWIKRLLKLFFINL